jgi:hypothetical protein
MAVAGFWAAPALPADPPKEPEEVTTAMLYIDRCLARMEQETDLTGDRAASVILSAERTVPVFWGADPATLSPATAAKIDEYPRRIREWIDKMNEAKSAKVLIEIEELSRKVHEWRNERQDGTRQVLIEHTAEVAGQMQKRLVGMTAGPSLDKAADLVVRLQTDLNNDRKEQLNRYQRKAIERCNQFNTLILCHTYVNDSAIIKDFDEAEIAAIDPGLLGAESRRIYEIAVGFMDGKLKSRNRANFLVKLTETKKWPLSDF